VPHRLPVKLMPRLLRNAARRRTSCASPARASDMHHHPTPSRGGHCTRCIALLCLARHEVEAEHPFAETATGSVDCQRTKIEASRGPFHELRELDLEDRQMRIVAVVLSCDAKDRMHGIAGQVTSGFSAWRAVPRFVGRATVHTLVNAGGVVPGSEPVDLGLNVEERCEEEREALPDFQGFPKALRLAVESWVADLALDVVDGLWSAADLPGVAMRSLVLAAPGLLGSRCRCGQGPDFARLRRASCRRSNGRQSFRELIAELRPVSRDGKIYEVRGREVLRGPGGKR